MLHQALAVLGARAVRPRRHLGRPLAGPRLEAAGLLAVVLTEGPHAQGLVGHTVHHAGSIVCGYNVDNVPTAVSILCITAGAVSQVTTAAAGNQLKSSGRLSAVVVAGSCAALRRARCRDHSARGGGFHTTDPPSTPPPSAHRVLITTLHPTHTAATGRVGTCFTVTRHQQYSNAAQSAEGATKLAEAIYFHYSFSLIQAPIGYYGPGTKNDLLTMSSRRIDELIYINPVGANFPSHMTSSHPITAVGEAE